jgi:hypothetical protein
MTTTAIGGWYPVPKGTQPAECKYCKAMIYFVRTKNDKLMPVDCEVDGGVEPTDIKDGAGISHFSDCPGADKARRLR